jgi:hypothetical protein
VEFEPTIPVFERTKIVHALYRAATVTGQNKEEVRHMYETRRTREMRNALKLQLEKELQGKRSPEAPTIKRALKCVLNDIDWIHLAQETGRWRSLKTTVRNLGILQHVLAS